MRIPFPTIVAVLALALLVPPPAGAAQTQASAATTVPASGVIGVEEAYLSPEFWVARLAAPDAVVLDTAAIAAQNARLLRLDDSMHDLRALPARLDRARVAGWIQALAQRPAQPLYDVDGQPVAAATLDAILANRALDAIPARQDTRYGMVLQRAALRAFPTDLRVFSRDGDTDIDRFQESALFPGTPVAIVHASGDGQWLFVVSERYAAWIQREAVAEGARDAVFAHADRTPYRIVTGAKPRTVFTREQPQLSELQLDMGVRMPLADVPPDQPVNGQHPYTSWVLELPLRNPDGSLGFAPALLPRTADTAADYLPLTRANLLRQAFKFLGERYGWGHSYNGRDCSGFVSDVYRSMGVQLPRNTSDQSVSPALNRIHFAPSDGRDKRMAALAALQVGDLVYIPGHVMMVAGRIGDEPYVIHDTSGGSYLGADGELRSMHLNGVSLTPLTPLMFNATQSYVDRITNIVRIRP
ncbi:SH3 domain-containing protein [Cognatiluteimonas weifangensis]|uniref:NlpC-P60 family protein n=1 Tax=Cognatiluteimonas weifangensis TaxID=2303539 RepID=A0A372DME9_9GAMM|nr:SH3 domain-containing protein [Luteimonas weifangensis]RFP60748.1 NlpC-P60 family protein [Luteimonas weifangensis]